MGSSFKGADLLVCSELSNELITLSKGLRELQNLMLQLALLLQHNVQLGCQLSSCILGFLQLCLQHSRCWACTAPTFGKHLKNLDGFRVWYTWQHESLEAKHKGDLQAQEDAPTAIARSKALPVLPQARGTWMVHLLSIPEALLSLQKIQAVSSQAFTIRARDG